MANPFFEGNSQKSSMNLNDIYKMLTTSNNPRQVFYNLARNNPKMAPIMTMLNSGMSPEVIFNNLCQQRGINPQEFIKNLSK